MRFLILGGTAEARALAAALVERGHEVTSSLAGRVSKPRLPVGQVRVGSFGGPEGLAAWVRSNAVDVVIDATHPFATGMSENAVRATELAGVELVRFARPGWADDELASSWRWVESYDEARCAADELMVGGGVPFITTGRQTLGHYRRAWAERPALVRVVEPLDDAAPAGWTVIHDRGPYDVAGELQVMRDHDVRVVLTKDSGGAYTHAKLDAAAQLGVDVVVVRRPKTVAGAHEATTTESAVELAETLASKRTAR